MSANPKIWAIIPAAGVGRRMGSDLPKQYMQLKGKSVLEHSVERILNCDAIEAAVIGLSANDRHWACLNIKHRKPIDTYIGGEARIHTVKRGLDMLNTHADPCDWIIIHDAVRPCVSKDDIEKLISVGLRSESGAILACPVIDTIKKIDSKDNTILETLVREELVLSLTPQLFPMALLVKAVDSAIQQNKLSTDEAQAVEDLGGLPLVVEGQRSNIKITTAEDLQLANALLHT